MTDGKDGASVPGRSDDGLGAAIHKDAWQRTLADMESMETELESDGWNVMTVRATHTTPATPDAGEDDRWGFVHVVADNFADEFSEAVDRGAYPTYRVFRSEMDNRQFMVTQLLDPDAAEAVLLASNFELRHAPRLVETALEEGYVLTHVQTLDGTLLGTFRHDDVEQFFPDPEKVLGYAERPSDAGES